MKIFYAVSDNGDGSTSVEFFDSQKAIDYLREHDKYGSYLDGDGGSGGSFEITGTDIKTDLDIQTFKQVKTQVAEDKEEADLD